MTIDFIRAVYRVEWMHGYSIRLFMYLFPISTYPYHNQHKDQHQLPGTHTSPPPHFTPGNPPASISLVYALVVSYA